METPSSVPESVWRDRKIRDLKKMTVLDIKELLKERTGSFPKLKTKQEYIDKIMELDIPIESPQTVSVNGEEFDAMYKLSRKNILAQADDKGIDYNKNDSKSAIIARILNIELVEKDIKSPLEMMTLPELKTIISTHDKTIKITSQDNIESLIRKIESNNIFSTLDLDKADVITSKKITKIACKSGVYHINNLSKYKALNIKVRKNTEGYLIFELESRFFVLNSMENPVVVAGYEPKTRTIFNLAIDDIKLCQHNFLEVEPNNGLVENHE